MTISYWETIVSVKFSFYLDTGTCHRFGNTFDNHRYHLFHLNYTPKLSRLKSRLNLWSTRDLTPLGRITIVKTLAISQLVFLFQILPDPPRSFIKELETVIFRFIWAGRPDRIKRNTLIGSYEQGGLKAPDVKSFIKSLKCNWVKRYNDGVSANWKLFFDYYLDMHGKDFLFKCNFQTNDISLDNIFLMDVCKAWSSYSYRNPTNNFKNEVIWNNSSIKIDGKVLFYKFMYRMKKGLYALMIYWITPTILYHL